jgi:hypothetical protein
VEKICGSLYDKLLIFYHQTQKEVCYIFWNVDSSHRLQYCINLFAYNRDQGFATFLTLNTTCMRKYQKKFGRKIYYFGKFQPKATV